MRRDCAGKLDAVEVSNAVKIAPPECVGADANGGHGTVWQLLITPGGRFEQTGLFRPAKTFFVLDF